MDSSLADCEAAYGTKHMNTQYQNLTGGTNTKYQFPYNDNNESLTVEFDDATGKMQNLQWSIGKWSYQTGKNNINTADEAKQYNLAPEDWHNHPCAVYFPELPKGVEVTYLEGQPITNENLSLYTGENGCTREQAEKFFLALKGMDYVEVVYEENSQERIQITYKTEDGMNFGANWRSDFQELGLHVFRE